jgi:hypothetical protein
VKSLLYFVAVLASFFLLLVAGALAGGFMLFPMGVMPALFGAATGAVVGVCVWFKVVGYFVELEDLHLRRDTSLAAPESREFADDGLSLSDRDVRRANHMMGSGVVTFFSSLFGPPETALPVGAIGVVFVAAGFIISLTGVEFPSEEGILRRVKLLVARNRA